MQEKINKWIANGCIYSEGIALLNSTGKFKQLIRSIAGRPHRYADKLRYELSKLAAASSGISTANFIKANPPKPASQVAASTLLVIPPPIIHSVAPEKIEDKNKQLPSEMEHVLKLYSDAFKTRAILHSAMCETSSDNSKHTIAKRKKLSDQIAGCSLVIDTMHKAKNDYYTNATIPDLNSLTSIYTSKPNSAALPNSIIELKEFKRQIQALLFKDRNMLAYQQQSKGKNENPMPLSPRRTKIELKMAERLTSIENIEIKIHELA